MSCRSGLLSRNGHGVPSSKRQKIEAGIFSELLETNGFILNNQNDPYTLNKDQALFQKDLQKSLRSHPIHGYPAIIGEFVKGLDRHVAAASALRWSLQFTESGVGCVASRGGQQDSLMRLLLNVEDLQTGVVDLLVEKLLEIAYSPSDDEPDLPRLILANLQGLERMVEAGRICDKMLELLESAPLEVQKEVTNALPEIVSDATHEKVAEKLCRLYYTTPDLSECILEALSGLALTAEVLVEVKHSVQKTIPATRPQHLPVAVKFLLEDAGKAEQLIGELRSRLRLTASSIGATSISQEATDSCYIDHQRALLSNIKFAFQVDRRQYMSWLKALDRVLSSAEHHPLDVLLLLLLCDDVGGAANMGFGKRQRLVESVLKKQVRAGVFTIDVLQRVFSDHGQIVKQFVTPLRRLAACLIRSGNSMLVGYGVEMYRMGFVSLDARRRQEVLMALVAHSCDACHVRRHVLRLLQRLAVENTDQLAPYTSFIKTWLDLLDKLSLPECRQLMELLNTLSCRGGDVQADGVEDDMRMLINKQLANSNIKYKRLGVISVIAAIKCRQDVEVSGSSLTASANEDVSSSAAGELSADQLLTSSCQRETVQLLEAVEAAVERAAAARGLLLDELAALVWRAGLVANVERWLCDRMMTAFQETFVADIPAGGEPDSTADLPLSLKYGLEEAGTGEIALNITALVRNSSGGQSISALCPHFRVLRMCVASLQSGSMEMLDALLGCPLILPADSTVSSIATLPPSLRHTVLTSLFAAANFFRELLNAFSTQKDTDLKKRCVQRLRDIMTLEAQIGRCLVHSPGFEPSCARFDLDPPAAPPALQPPTKKLKRKAKAGKNKPAPADDSVLVPSSCTAGGPSQLPSTAAGDASEDQAAVGPGSASAGSSTGPYRLFYREFDMDVFKLLYRRFSLTETTTESFCVRPSELLFLLDDLVLKLTHCLSANSSAGGGGFPGGLGGGGNRRRGHSNLDLLPCPAVARQAATLLKPLSMIADGIVNMFKSQMADNDGILDGSSTTLGSEYGRLAACLSAVYRVICLVITWPGLREPDNHKLMDEAIGNLRLSDNSGGGFLASQLPASSSCSSGGAQRQLAAAASTAAAAGRAFRLLEQHAAVIGSAECAANLLRTLSTLAERAADPAITAALESLAESLLKREWFAVGGARETGATYNSQVDVMLRTYLSNPATSIGHLEKLSQIALVELLESPGRCPVSETFSTLCKSTFVTYYKSMFHWLLAVLRCDVAGSPTASQANAGAGDSEMVKLQRWTSSIRVFSQLVTSLKVFSGRTVVALCLKSSRMVVDMFVRHAIPVLETLLKHHKEDVMSTLKSFQLSARYLHHVCNHSKSSKEASLVRYVPLLKKGLETFVFRVKAMLAMNGCTEAFWMGNLKNRDLQGDEIISQRSSVDAEGSGSDGEVSEAAAPRKAEEEELSDLDLDLEDAEDRSTSSAAPENPAAEDAGEEKHDSEISDAY